MDGLSGKSRDCSEFHRLKAELAFLREHVKELQEKLGAQNRKTKRQAAPFRHSKKAKESESSNSGQDSGDSAAPKKKPGRKPGHQPAHRTRPDHVDRTIDVPAGMCPDCHVAIGQTQTFVNFQTDIPPVTPVVTQFNVEVGFCLRCGKRV